MTTENVVEGAVKCLKVINPDFKMSHLFPPGLLLVCDAMQCAVCYQIAISETGFIAMLLVLHWHSHALK